MQRQTAAAEERFRNWVQRQPEDTLAHAWLGAALAAQPGRETEAEAQFQEALKLDGKSADARLRLAALWERRGKREEAQAEWRKFLELEPNSDRAWLVKHGLAVVETRPLGAVPEKLGSVDWSPDGKWIVCTAASADWLTKRLYLVDAVAGGVVGQGAMTLKPGEVVECPLVLAAAKEAGTYTVKLTATTANGERVVELVDYEAK